LWVNGNPGAGKSILCSAIIEDTKIMREAGSALIAWYYFDFKDAAKRDVRGLLTSLLFQLGDDCVRCRDVLHHLFTTCRDGSEQPSDAALAGCLKEMLELPGQLPIFIIVDALDECPNTTGTPSAREEVLDFVEDLVGSNHSNLFICVTSRPEHDIQTILNPLTPASRRVSLHEEGGQREDIDSYIRSFVLKDRAMRRWREEDRELVITTLSQRAQGMFRWVFCQLDTLRRCMASSIRKALNELPTTLDDTYERALQEIPKEKWQHAHRLFQCLVAAIRPLRVEELAEIFAIRFDADRCPSLTEGWRPENPEEALLSACSTLITIVENYGRKIVQFSHFSVKEFLTSDRLQTSEVGNVCDYHIPLDAAHTILARTCLTVLLQLDENVDKERLRMFPLAFYAAEHWVEHAKFEDVALRIQNDMKRLFNPRNPYLAAWVWMYNVDEGYFQYILAKHPSPPNATALYYASLCGFSGVANYIICTHGEDVNAKSGYYETPLQAASYKGHVDVVRVLLDHGANVNTMDKKNTPLSSACRGGHLEIMGLLLEHGADVDVWYDSDDFVLHRASDTGQAELMHLLLRHNADVNARGYLKWTPLHRASFYGHTKLVRVLLDHGADINILSEGHNTPLCVTIGKGFLEVVQLLLERGADVDIKNEIDRTPYQLAESGGLTEIVQLLLKHGARKE
jgi:ankyrin repeat protein